MGWVLVVGVLWLAAAVAVAALIGRAVHVADAKVPRSVASAARSTP